MIYAVIAVSALLLVIIIYVIVVHNSLAKLKTMVNEAFSTMDIFLKKRWDLLTKLVEATKGYSKHELKTLSDVVSLRSGYNNLSNDEKIKKNLLLDDNIPNMGVVIEDYPDLKANELFINLTKEISEIEDEIEKSRRYYNGVCRAYNTKLVVFPSSIVAKLFSFQKELMFVADENSRNDVKTEI